MKNFLLICILVLVGCRTWTPPSMTIPPGKWPEAEALPPEPSTEPLVNPATGDAITGEEHAYDINEDDCILPDGRVNPVAKKPCPGLGGVLFTEAKFARWSLYRLRYDQLRVILVSDRQEWAAQRVLYETRLKLADKALFDAQPNWWERHAFDLGIVGGIVVGAAATIAIVAITD